MDSSVWRISYEGDATEARKYVRLAQQQLARLGEFMRPGELAVCRRYFPLDEAGYLYVHVAGGINIAHIVINPGRSVPLGTFNIPNGEPDYLGGYVMGGMLVEDSADPTHILCDSLYPTQTSATFQNKFQPPPPEDPTIIPNPDQPTLVPNEPNKIGRLGLEPDPGVHGDAAAPPNNVKKFSQYRHLKPSLFSGRMREVVQVVMGLGKPRKQSIYGSFDVYDDTEENREIEDSIYVSEFQKKFMEDGYQLKYDYHWYRTNGIVTGPDKKLWLVQIANVHGLLVMPLPVYERTTTKEFYEFIDSGLVDPNGNKVTDVDGKKIIDELGGFPTGETFPTSKIDIDAYIRAGIIQQLLTPDEMNVFYKNFPYASGLGWAFSKSGKEAHNTCWNAEDSGLQYGLHFEIGINIGASDTETDEEKEANKGIRNTLRIAILGLRAHFNELFPKSPIRFEALLAKADRMKPEQIADLYGQGGDLIVNLDNLELPKIATASAHISQAGKGNLLQLNRNSPFQLKFGELAINGLLTHDMSLLEPINGASKPDRSKVKCDTVVHVFFREETLIYVKFFSAPAKTTEETTDDFEPCSLGSFTRTEKRGSVTNTGYYSNEVDEREEVSESLSVTTTKVTDMGYTSADYDFVAIFAIGGTAVRNKSFKTETHNNTKNGRGKVSACIVPLYEREAYYIPYSESVGNETDTYSGGYFSTRDPNVYNICAWDFLWHWRGGCDGDACGGYVGFSPVGSSYYPPSFPAKISSYAGYRPFGPCPELADSGGWKSNCDAPDVYDIALPPIELPPNKATANQGSLKTYYSSSATNGPIAAQNYPMSTSVPHFTWYDPSPVNDLTLFIYSVACCFGEAKDLTIFDTHEQGTAADRKVLNGNASDIMKSGLLPTFLGVYDG